MNKLTSLFAAAALSVVATQASAATFIMAGVIDDDALNACDILGCTKGAAGEVHIITNDDVNDGIATGADLVAAELWTTMDGVLSMTATFDASVLHATDPNGGFTLTWDVANPNDVLSMDVHNAGAPPFPHIVWNGVTGETAVGLGTGCEDTVTLAGCNLGSSTHMFEGGSWTSSLASPVPVPAAAWLFGSAMLGLVGVGRKRRA